MNLNKNKIAKIAVKAGVGFVISAGIGYAIKLERHIGAKIDAYGVASKVVEIVTEV